MFSYEVKYLPLWLCAKRDEGGYEFIYFVSSFQFHLCITCLDPILEWYHAVAVEAWNCLTGT